MREKKGAKSRVSSAVKWQKLLSYSTCVWFGRGPCVFDWITEGLYLHISLHIKARGLHNCHITSVPSQVCVWVCEAESIRAKQDQREVRLPHAQVVGTHLTSSPHTHRVFYCKVQCEGDKWKKYKPIDTNVGYDQRDDTLVMDDFLSRFSRPSLPLFCCVVMISFQHTFVPVIVLLCATMRISSAHYRL